MRYLGVDPGGRRLGLAVGDDVCGATAPLEVVACRDRARAVRAIAEAMRRQGAGCVVIGLPTAADGSETPACARSRALAEALGELGIETELQPEHLSTDEARRRARTMGRRPDLPVDDIAAQVILEDHLAACGSSREGTC